jgi:hypothetical protein
MSQTVIVEGIKAVPAVLWVAFAALVFLTLRRALAPQLDRLSNVKTPVFEMSFAEQLLDEAAAKTQTGPVPPGAARIRRYSLPPVSLMILCSMLSMSWSA